MKLYVYTSRETIGIFLPQKNFENSTGNEIFVYYLSRSLVDSEIRYNVVEKLFLPKSFEVFVTFFFNFPKNIPN